jgi:hypothetical protein
MGQLATRQEVYGAIDSERDYQDMRIVRDGSTADPNEHYHTPEEFLVYMNAYLQDTMSTAARVWGPACKPAILDGIRKVVGLGVACMEMNGAPKREMPQ